MRSGCLSLIKGAKSAKKPYRNLNWEVLRVNSASGFAFNSGQLRCDMWGFVKNFKDGGTSLYGGAKRAGKGRCAYLPMRTLCSHFMKSAG